METLRNSILGNLEEYRLVIPTSTDSKGGFVSKVVSGALKRRFPRDTRDLPQDAAGKEIFYNVTVFGQEFHFRLRPNSRLVAPGATVEWQEDSNITYTEPLHGDCLYVGHITDLPNASVAISNCDGLLLTNFWQASALLTILDGDLGLGDVQQDDSTWS
ncbi:A disintegrin and metalloproteinase with thrombospondin motifs 2, partial [Ophiophagus hannah]